jgi:hypothetical protein
MSDIFLSYATEDRATAGLLVKTLEAAGWSVFWDRVTPVGKSWDRVLEEQLVAARAVTPLWSPRSVRSDWVLIEAAEGMERKKLFPALIAPEQDTHIPIRFKLTEYADLSDWHGKRSHEGCVRLLAALASQLQGGSAVSEVVVPEADLEFRRPRKQHDVFLGYARDDHVRATSLAAALEQVGVGVWFDRAIVVGESFSDTIMAALEAARAVIILWTAAGVQSAWVRAEAQFAMNAGILVGVLADRVTIPREFASVPSLDLTTWAGDTRDPDFQRMLVSLKAIGIHSRRNTATNITAPASHTVQTSSESSATFTWVHLVSAALVAGGVGALLVFLLLRAV